MTHRKGSKRDTQNDWMVFWKAISSMRGDDGVIGEAALLQVP